MATEVSGKRGDLLGPGTWAGQVRTGVSRGICTTNCKAKLVNMLLMLCKVTFVLKYTLCIPGICPAEQERALCVQVVGQHHSPGTGRAGTSMASGCRGCPVSFPVTGSALVLPPHRCRWMPRKALLA